MFEPIMLFTRSPSLAAMASSPAISTTVQELVWLWRALNIHVALFVMILLSLTITPIQSDSNQPSLQANQVMPLSGQLILTRSPDHSLPVYISVGLTKVLSVDEIQYRFTADLEFLLAWEDHKALKTIFAAQLDYVNDYFDQENASDACRKFLSTGDSAEGNIKTLQAILDDYTSVSSSASAEQELKTSCEKLAYQQKEKHHNCKRFCSPQDALICCDSMYLPGFYLTNLVDLPLNGPVTDVILPRFPNETLDQPFISRVVTFQGTFSTPLNFKRFPFDSQQLEIQVSTQDSVPYIVKSGLFRGEAVGGPKIHKDSTFSSENSEKEFRKSDELAGWEVVSMRWAPSDNKTEVFNVTEYESFETSDPVGPFFQAVLKTDSGTELNTNLTSCSLRISIKRTFLFHFVTIVLPSMITVFLALLPLLLSPAEIELRFTATVTLFLALVAVQYSNTSSLPKSTYLTDFHWFIIFSYGIMVLIAIENLIIYFLFNQANEGAQIASLSRNTEEGPIELMEEAAKTETQPQTSMIALPVHEKQTPKSTKTKSKLRKGFYTVNLSDLNAKRTARRKERMKKLGQLKLHRWIKIVDRLCFFVLTILYLVVTRIIFQGKMFNK